MNIWVRFAGMAIPAAAGMVLVLLVSTPAGAREYVGSEACALCHEDVYNSFETYAKKAHSFESVQVMAPDLTREELAECYSCHTTGYGQPSGFDPANLEQSVEKGLHNAGCEVCHGPGSEHVESGDREDIEYELDIEDCAVCHNSERVADFNYKPLLHGGAH